MPTSIYPSLWDYFPSLVHCPEESSPGNSRLVLKYNMDHTTSSGKDGNPPVSSRILRRKFPVARAVSCNTEYNFLTTVDGICTRKGKTIANISVLKFPGPQQSRCNGTAIAMSANLYNCYNHSGIINFGTTITCRDLCLFNLAFLHSLIATNADPGASVHTKHMCLTLFLQKSLKSI